MLIGGKQERLQLSDKRQSADANTGKQMLYFIVH